MRFAVGGIVARPGDEGRPASLSEEAREERLPECPYRRGGWRKELAIQSEGPTTYPWLALERARRFLRRGMMLQPQIGTEAVRRDCEDCLAAAIVFGDSALEQLGKQVGKDLKRQLKHHRPLIDFMTRVRNSEVHSTVTHFSARLHAQQPMEVCMPVVGGGGETEPKVRHVWVMGPDGATDERDRLRLSPNRGGRQTARFSEHRRKQWNAFTNARAVRLISAYLRTIEREFTRHDPCYHR
jgi:hypothetical protein